MWQELDEEREVQLTNSHDTGRWRVWKVPGGGGEDHRSGLEEYATGGRAGWAGENETLSDARVSATQRLGRSAGCA